MKHTPKDWKSPKWEREQLLEWTNHISKEIREMWDTFTDVQKQALARSAYRATHCEEW